MEGNLYFGSAYDLENKIEYLLDKSKIFILRMKTVVTIDVTALDEIKTFIRRVKENGGTIIVCGISAGLNEMLIKSNINDIICNENIFMSENKIFASSMKALNRAKELIRKSEVKKLAAN